MKVEFTDNSGKRVTCSGDNIYNSALMNKLVIINRWGRTEYKGVTDVVIVGQYKAKG